MQSGSDLRTGTLGTCANRTKGRKVSRVRGVGSNPTPAWFGKRLRVPLGVKVLLVGISSWEESGLKVLAEAGSRRTWICCSNPVSTRSRPRDPLWTRGERVLTQTDNMGSWIARWLDAVEKDPGLERKSAPSAISACLGTGIGSQGSDRAWVLSTCPSDRRLPLCFGSKAAMEQTATSPKKMKKRVPKKKQDVASTSQDPVPVTVTEDQE
ncbi:hypothetical protein R1sor_027521 [Riccia sorocarpa]|uniref:Uncharacterized protein n=1 Tax=Riccia sorocarpa TaxID=122646 RepID=A0ABD3GF69_9MARC